MKKYNFNAGPSILPQETIDGTVDAIRDFGGLSIMEISHRSKEFEAVVNETTSLFRDLLQVPDGYAILFLGGGASLQFCMAPYNLLERKAAYLNTGTWAAKAQKEAKFFGEVVEVASSKEANYTYIPKNYAIPHDADYFHVTTNNTIFGTELHEDITSPVPLVADMSSDILSRQIEVSKYGLIYGGAQKNLGPAGVAFVIIREDILGKVSRKIPTMLDYKTHIKENSLYNTPPVVPIYAMLQTLKWVKSIGGVAEIQRRNRQKARMLYEEIDRNSLFRGTAAIEDRSLMNICFVMNDPSLETEFLHFAVERGMVGIKGHRSVGGFRASTYNALPAEAVNALIETMQDFEKAKQ
ncbi:MAG: 3-phosphoserine/phosphohydroxythreonine transaminase [Dysgonamonadaceae bacterium]|jgi:phosphoserine aminotransferase|nr:3-phosphoserine/phosphohydroxythreonine transaminase [Dysgonamonadaceae bacterium]